MKRQVAFFLLLTIFLISGWSCSHPNNPAQITQPAPDREVTLIPETWCGDPTTTTLYAGQNIDIGEVNVYNNEGFIYVDFVVDEPWVLTETHVAVYENLSDFPTTKSGQPKVGRFDFNINSEIPYDVECGKSLYVAAHAAVEKLDADGNTIQSETAWGDGTQFNASGSWAMYFTHEVQCCPKDPPLPPAGGHVGLSIIPGSGSYITTTLWNVPTGEGFVVWDDNDWLGWCTDKYKNIYYPYDYTTAHLLSSLNPSTWPAEALADPRLDKPWDKINYIINHKGSNSVADIQAAIWFLTDIYTVGMTPAAQAIVDEANLYGEGWYPVHDQNMALICWFHENNPLGTYGPIQVTFIEVDP